MHGGCHIALVVLLGHTPPTLGHKHFVLVLGHTGSGIDVKSLVNGVGTSHVYVCVRVCHLPPNAYHSQVADVSSLVGVDVGGVLNLAPSLHELWSLPLQMVVALALLYMQVCVGGCGCMHEYIRHQMHAT